MIDRIELDQWLRERDYVLVTREQAHIFDGPGVVPWDEHRRALAKADAAIKHLRTENRQLRMRLDEMDIRAGEVLDAPVIDGRTSVRPEHVAALRATMQRPLDQEEMPR